MSHSANNDLLNVPTHQPAPRPARERVDSIDDLTKLAPELDRQYLTVEPPRFATGAFSDVFRGVWAPPGEQAIEVAVKVLRTPGGSTGRGQASENQLYGKHLGREIFVWQRVNHHRITPLMGYIREYEDGVVPCIVTKLRRQGNLLEYLAENPEADRLRLVCQAVEGLIYLHTFEPHLIIHLDLKPSNILVTDDGEAELCDFGYAKVLGGGPSGYTTSPNPGGTYPYMSPEVLDGVGWKGLTPAADIFAMGSTILYALSGKRAWDSVKAKGTLMMKVLNGIPPAREDNPMEGSEEAVNALWDLLVRCWKKEPKERPSAEEVLERLLEIKEMGGVRPPPATPDTAMDQSA